MRRAGLTIVLIGLTASAQGMHPAQDAWGPWQHVMDCNGISFYVALNVLPGTDDIAKVRYKFVNRTKNRKRWEAESKIVSAQGQEDHPRGGSWGGSIGPRGADDSPSFWYGHFEPKVEIVQAGFKMVRVVNEVNSPGSGAIYTPNNAGYCDGKLRTVQQPKRTPSTHETDKYGGHVGRDGFYYDRF